MVRREDRIAGTEVRGHVARRTTDVIDEKSLERLRNLAEEMEGLAHRNFSDHGEEVELLAACNNDLHNIEASGNSRLQGVAERVAEVFLDLEASYWYGPHERMLPILPDTQQ